MILYLTICVSYPEKNIAIPEDTPKSTFSKENDSFYIFQDHLHNALQSSKMLLKYTDHSHDKQGHLTQALLHKNEPLRWFWTRFTRVLKLSSCYLCMKIVSWYVLYCETNITILTISWGDCIIIALVNTVTMFAIQLLLLEIWNDLFKVYKKYSKKCFG